MNSTPTPSLAAPAETRRRAQILAAAGRAFVHKGYHGTTIRDIAAEAGVAPGTLYLYFAGKHEILTGFFDEVVNAAAMRMGDLAALPLEEALETFVRERLEVLQELGDVVKVVFSEALYDDDLRAKFGEHVLHRTRQLVLQLLEGYGLQVLPAAQLNAVAQTLQAHVVYWGILRPNLEPSEPRNPAQEARVIADLMMGGIRGLLQEAASSG
jgi:AcrR family transcriptional regulator